MMSRITYTKDNKVTKRQGEFYEVDSCYTTPRSIRPHPRFNDLLFAGLESDVDELTNKPRRFFDHLLSVMEYKRDNDPLLDKGNHREYWQGIIKGCELWLSAVNNGVYGEVLQYAQKVGDAEPPITNADVIAELLGNEWRLAHGYEYTPAEALSELTDRGLSK